MNVRLFVPTRDKLTVQVNSTFNQNIWVGSSITMTLNMHKARATCTCMGLQVVGCNEERPYVKGSEGVSHSSLGLVENVTYHCFACGKCLHDNCIEKVCLRIKLDTLEAVIRCPQAKAVVTPALRDGCGLSVG